MPGHEGQWGSGDPGANGAYDGPGQNCDNAFWEGWYMVFGDGLLMDRLTEVIVAAHGLAPGVDPGRLHSSSGCRIPFSTRVLGAS